MLPVTNFGIPYKFPAMSFSKMSISHFPHQSLSKRFPHANKAMFSSMKKPHFTIESSAENKLFFESFFTSLTPQRKEELEQSMRKELRSKDTYSSLPRLPWEFKFPYTKKYLFNPAAQITTALWQPLLHTMTNFIPRSLSLMPVSITPSLSNRCQKRLHEAEEKVQEIAKKMGIVHPDKIKVYIILKSLDSPAATGIPAASPTIILPPEWLLHPGDLPDYLKLERLDAHAIEEEEWLQDFELWLTKIFVNFNNDYPTQFDADLRKCRLKAWLQLFKNPDLYEKALEAILGHELAHIHYHHMLKLPLCKLGLQALSIHLFWPLLLCTNFVMDAYKRHLEKEADIHSARILKHPNELIVFLKEFEESIKELEKKYPELINYRKIFTRSSHPPLSKRTQYLNDLKC